MSFISKSFKLLSIAALNGAVATVAACASPPADTHASTDQAATQSEKDLACGVRRVWNLLMQFDEGPEFKAVPADFSTWTGITDLTDVTGYYAFVQESGGDPIFAIQKANGARFFYTRGKLISYIDHIDAEMAAYDGDALDCPPEPDDNKPETTCLSKDPINASAYSWQSSRNATKGACTTKEISDFSAYYKAHAADTDLATTWGTSVSDGCSKCVFSNEIENQWGPIVLEPTPAGTTFEVNRGSCFETVSGNAGCGRAEQQFETCLVDACLKDCKTQEQFTACRQDASVLTTSCKDAFTNLKTSCGEQHVGEYQNACRGTTYTFEGPIRVLCGQ